MLRELALIKVRTTPSTRPEILQTCGDIPLQRRGRVLGLDNTGGDGRRGEGGLADTHTEGRSAYAR